MYFSEPETACIINKPTLSVPPHASADLSRIKELQQRPFLYICDSFDIAPNTEMHRFNTDILAPGKPLKRFHGQVWPSSSTETSIQRK